MNRPIPFDRLVVAAIERHTLVELTVDDIPALQAFYSANPGYSQLVMGRAPRPTEAYDDFHDLPPAEFPMNKKLMIGLVDGDRHLIGVADIVSDLFAKDVWHIGFFMVAESRHGSGVARQFYQALEQWMEQNGARWLRLGVVLGNRRGEMFWRRSGFAQVRTREDYQLGDLRHTLLVMAKPLGANSLVAYLECVARDRPE